MALSINWQTQVITVPKADLTLISGTLYELDTDAFRLELKSLEDDEEGIPFPDTHTHNTEVTVAGETYVRTIEIINGYSVTFEDGQYTVKLVGSNNNIFDVENGILNQNQVQIIPTNSAGHIVVSVGSGLSTEEHDQLMGIENPPSQVLNDYKADVSGLATAGEYDTRLSNMQTDIDAIVASITDIDLAVTIIGKLTGNRVIKSGDIITIYEDDESTPWRQYNLANGGRVEV